MKDKLLKYKKQQKRIEAIYKFRNTSKAEIKYVHLKTFTPREIRVVCYFKHLTTKIETSEFTCHAWSEPEFFKTLSNLM